MTEVPPVVFKYCNYWDQKVGTHYFESTLGSVNNYCPHHQKWYEKEQFLLTTLYLEYEKNKDSEDNIRQLTDQSTGYTDYGKFLADFLTQNVNNKSKQDEHHSNDLLVISTIHQAKGLEWRYVYLMNVIQNKFPNLKALAKPNIIDDSDELVEEPFTPEKIAGIGEVNSEALEEERRLFYVAITRPKDKLIITYPENISVYGGSSLGVNKSSFLTEITDQNLFSYQNGLN